MEFKNYDPEPCDGEKIKRKYGGGMCIITRSGITQLFSEAVYEKQNLMNNVISSDSDYSSSDDEKEITGVLSNCDLYRQELAFLELELELLEIRNILQRKANTALIQRLKNMKMVGK